MTEFCYLHVVYFAKAKSTIFEITNRRRGDWSTIAGVTAEEGFRRYTLRVFLQPQKSIAMSLTLRGGISSTAYSPSLLLPKAR